MTSAVSPELTSTIAVKTSFNLIVFSTMSFPGIKRNGSGSTAGQCAVTMQDVSEAGRFLAKLILILNVNMSTMIKLNLAPMDI